MSKRLVVLIAAIVAFSFVYLHFEFFPGRIGPDDEMARAEVKQWARQASGQSYADVSVVRVNARNPSGVSVVDVEFRNFYYEANGLGQRYTGRGQVEFVRVGGMFRPAWTISQVRLVDAQQALTTHRR